MAEARNKAASVNLKEKNSVLDLDIGTDFLSSWKSMSVGDADVMDFDLPPVSKGKKKSFDFEQADMDFNLDGDFGNMPSFNMDMSDLDISPPLKKDGRAMEKLKESTENDTGKADRFNFAFDFDRLDDFNIDATLTKEDSRVLKEKNKMGTSPNKSKLQDNEGSSMDVAGKMNNLENVMQKTSFPGDSTSFDVDFHVSESAVLEPTRKKSTSETMDSFAPSKLLNANDEVDSDNPKTSDITVDSVEPSKVTQSEKSIYPAPVDLEACTENNGACLLPSNLNQPSGISSGETRDKVDCVDTNAIILAEGQDIEMTSVVSATSDNKLTVFETSEYDACAIHEKNNGEKSLGEIENHVRDNKESSKGRVTPIVENSSISVSEPEVLSDTVTGRGDHESASEILKLASISHSVDNLLPKEEMQKQKEPPESSKEFIQSESFECRLRKASLVQTKGELCQKKGFAQPNGAEGRSNLDRIQSHRKLASLSLSHSQTQYVRELPQTHSQQTSKVLNIQRKVSGADMLQNKKQSNSFPAAQNLNVVKGNSSPGKVDTSVGGPDTLRKICKTDEVQGTKLNNCPTEEHLEMLPGESSQAQRETNTKHQVTLSSRAAFPSSNTEIQKGIAQNSKFQTSLAPLPLGRNTHEGPKLSAVVESRKTTDLCGQKLSSLNLQCTKPSSQKDGRSVGNISLTKVLIRNKPLEITCPADALRKTPPTLSMKRKKSEENDADRSVLYPSKRASQSPIRNRQIVQTSEKDIANKESNHNAMEDDSIKNHTGDCQVSVYEIPNGMNIKAVETSFSIEKDSNIKQAEAYAKELDDICNMLRKKQEEAKELLVRALVNSNKLLMLNHPILQEKISVTQNLLARLTLNEGHA